MKTYLFSTSALVSLNPITDAYSATIFRMVSVFKPFFGERNRKKRIFTDVHSMHILKRTLEFIFLIISWVYRYTLRMSTFQNYQCASNNCWAVTTSNLRMRRRVGALCNLPKPTVQSAVQGPSEGWALRISNNNDTIFHVCVAIRMEP